MDGDATVQERLLIARIHVRRKHWTTLRKIKQTRQDEEKDDQWNQPPFFLFP
jgi:hypothetical protein